MDLVSLLLLAVVDSINPSAIVVTLTLISIGRSPIHVALYIAAVFVTYLTVGFLALLGIDSLLPPLGDILRSRPGLIGQCLTGAALLVFALRAKPEPAPMDIRSTSAAGTGAAIIALGVGVTLLEMPTAIPYLAAIAILTAGELGLEQWAPLLVGYNVIFVSPLCLLLAGHVVLGDRFGDRYEAFRARLEQGARTTTLWVLGIVGSLLVSTGVIEYAFRYGS